MCQRHAGQRTAEGHIVCVLRDIALERMRIQVVHADVHVPRDVVTRRDFSRQIPARDEILASVATDGRRRFSEQH